MLSNPTNNLHTRQRQHRRQNSTPTAFEPVKATNLRKIPRHAAHRRGMSLDQRRRQSPPQDIEVSTTNQGYQTTQQHILRETQQQRLSRPGQQFHFDNDENYLSSPAVTPLRQSFDASCMNYEESAPPLHSYDRPINSVMRVDPSSFSGGSDFNLFASETVLATAPFLNFQPELENVNQVSDDKTFGRRCSNGRRISGGIFNRVAQFENLALQPTERPITPPNQNALNYFPPTPTDTPHGRVVKHDHLARRFFDSFDTSLEETIKPKSAQRNGGVFEDMRREAEMNSMPSPPMPAASSFDSAPMPTSNFMNMSNLDMKFIKSEAQFGDAQNSPGSTNPSPTLSYDSSPEISKTTLMGDFLANEPVSNERVVSYPEPPSTANYAISRSSVPSSPHRRSESVSSINIEEVITDTGITVDDIATFIEGPDPQDGKWVCLYPGCQKRFGRKENIKSHVQTHLGDRQFQCPHCKKCFVRQHDLKRHAKIHSGIKPYPCQCGNSFARHDALTRHRQRGMCIGAFDGIVKKTMKRGRPRKNRPDDEKRHQKSSRTRAKNKAMSSASSTTGYSESSGANSPRSDLDLLDGDAFGDYQLTQGTTEMEMGSSSFVYSQPQSPTAKGCVSPQDIENAASPAAFSTHSQYPHHGSISEQLPSPPRSPAKSIQGQYHSPPGLCHSSSSPAPSNHYYDMDSISNHGDEMINLSALTNISNHDDELFLDAFATQDTNDLTQLERDPDLLLGKFDDTFGSANNDDLFKEEGDVFFGSA